MDHIWGAPCGLKKSLALIFLMKSAIILRQEFLKTLYKGRKEGSREGKEELRDRKEEPRDRKEEPRDRKEEPTE